jgi:hypothetical protein
MAALAVGPLPTGALMPRGVLVDALVGALMIAALIVGPGDWA